MNLAFFSGNEIFWKTRWEPSIDGSGTAVPHPGLLQGDATPDARIDPDPDVDRHLAGPPLQPAGRRRPPGERADRHDVHGQRGPRPIGIPHEVPADDAKLRFWRNTSVASLARRADGHTGDRRPRLRVGRGRGQRVPARPA